MSPPIHTAIYPPLTSARKWYGSISFRAGSPLLYVLMCLFHILSPHTHNTFPSTHTFVCVCAVCVRLIHSDPWPNNGLSSAVIARIHHLIMPPGTKFPIEPLLTISMCVCVCVVCACACVCVCVALFLVQSVVPYELFVCCGSTHHTGTSTAMGILSQQVLWTKDNVLLKSFGQENGRHYVQEQLVDSCVVFCIHYGTRGTFCIWFF